MDSYDEKPFNALPFYILLYTEPRKRLLYTLADSTAQNLQNYTYCTSSIAERILKNETVKALEMARENTTLCVCEHHGEDFNCKVTSCLQRTVMNHLRHAGYNAAICNSQFKYMAGGFPHKGKN